MFMALSFMGATAWHFARSRMGIASGDRLCDRVFWDDFVAGRRDDRLGGTCQPGGLP